MADAMDKVISCRVSHFYEVESEIWAGFGRVGSTEKKIAADYEHFLRTAFSLFIGKRRFFLLKKTL